jgi:hypothetical protein
MSPKLARTLHELAGERRSPPSVLSVPGSTFDAVGEHRRTTRSASAAALLMLIGCVSGSPSTSPSVAPSDGHPQRGVVAIVFGVSILESDLQSTSLDEMILDPLFTKYRRDHGIAASRAEIKECWSALNGRTDEPQLAFPRCQRSCRLI